MNEFEAAMGLCVLDDIDKIKRKRKQLIECYKRDLEGLVEFQNKNYNSNENYSYMPVVFKNEKELLMVVEALNKRSIYPRRYFYPSLDTLQFIDAKQDMKISRDISKRILCLPIYNSLAERDRQEIVYIIKNYKILG